MQNAIGISLTDRHCYAAIVRKKIQSFECTQTLVFECDFNDRNALQKALKQLQPYCRKQRVVFGLSSENVMIRDVSIDVDLPDAQVMAFLHTQSYALFGHDAAKLYIDYESQLNDENNQRQILAVAAQRSTVDPYRKYFSIAKINLNCIDAEPFAIARFKKRTQKNDKAIRFSIPIGLALWEPTL